MLHILSSSADLLELPLELLLAVQYIAQKRFDGYIASTTIIAMFLQCLPFHCRIAFKVLFYHATA